jgi:hypothetical protein
MENSKRSFCVIFRFDVISKSEYLHLLDSSIDTSSLPCDLSTKIKSFLKEDENVRFQTYSIEALDFYQAIQRARELLSTFLDSLHIAFENIQLLPNQDVLVINQEKKNEAKIQNINFLIDGGYLEKDDKYEALKYSLDSIMNNSAIASSVKAKINSAIRYLRMGNEAQELEQKYISYWIALEHIFSINQKDTSTINRMFEHLTKIQVVYYCKRNAQYIHNSIKKRVQKNIISHKFPFVLVDISYFMDDASLEKLSDNIKYTPLLSYTVSKIKSAFHHKDKTKHYVKRHEDNVKMHISRLYRVRNEIMHEAAIIPNIENLTGNLRYYLIFTLNLLLSYFSSISIPDSKIAKLATLNDFFQHQSLLYNIIETSGYKKEVLFKVEISENILV